MTLFKQLQLYCLIPAFFFFAYEDDSGFQRTNVWAECDALSLCPQELSCWVTGREEGTLWPGHGTFHTTSSHIHFTLRVTHHQARNSKNNMSWCGGCQDSFCSIQASRFKVFSAVELLYIIVLKKGINT